MNASFRLVAIAISFSLLANACGAFAQDRKSEPRIVGKILAVDYVEEEIKPPNLIVTATGEVPTAGFTKPTLVRAVYVTPPADGIQDYFLMAVPPSGPAATVVSQVKASDKWKAFKVEAPWIKGVRVHGVGDGVMLKVFSK